MHFNPNLPARFNYRTPHGLIFEAGLTQVAVMDTRGRILWQAQVAPQEKPAWDGRDRFGNHVPPGSYLCKITDENGGTFYVPFILLG